MYVLCSLACLFPAHTIFSSQPTALQVAESVSFSFPPHRISPTDIFRSFQLVVLDRHVCPPQRILGVWTLLEGAILLLSLSFPPSSPFTLDAGHQIHLPPRSRRRPFPLFHQLPPRRRCHLPQTQDGFLNPSQRPPRLDLHRTLDRPRARPLLRARPVLGIDLQEEEEFGEELVDSAVFGGCVAVVASHRCVSVFPLLPVVVFPVVLFLPRF
jgi:hypothetical protein